MTVIGTRGVDMLCREAFGSTSSVDIQSRPVLMNHRIVITLNDSSRRRQSRRATSCPS